MQLTELFRRRKEPAAIQNPEVSQEPAAIPGGSEWTGSMPAVEVETVIGRKEIGEAITVLKKYKEGKANLESRIVKDEEWYKARQWRVMPHKKSQVEPASAWLFNSIANKHADAMDNFPTVNVLPRERGDVSEAKILSSILPVVFDECDFEGAYSAAWMQKLKSGTGVYGVFWDAQALGGLGSIVIKRCDPLNLFWEPGISDIQQSRHFFSVEMRDNQSLIEAYPQLKGRIGGTMLTVSEYLYDDAVDTTDKSIVVDWYYKKRMSNGRNVLHYCKFVGDTVLYASENDPALKERGWYDHGRYPFEFDPLFPVEGSPCGIGYIDIAKDAQEYIDRGNQAILKNMLVNARPRFFVRKDGAVNIEEFADLNNDFVHVDGNLGDDTIRPIAFSSLSDVYVSVINNKIDELKEVTGNRDISTGGTTSGVTAASAIAAMQEAGSKLSRDNIKASYRVYRKIALDVIELIRQFYDVPRYFRVLGEGGAMDFISYSNKNIALQEQGSDFGVAMGERFPLFDVELTAQKASPYSKLSQNELALEFFSRGFFNPMMAQQALLCLDIMDFDRKDIIMQKIAQNAMMIPQMPAMPSNVQGGAISGVTDEESGAGESTVTKNARQRVAESASPT